MLPRGHILKAPPAPRSRAPVDPLGNDYLLPFHALSTHALLAMTIRHGYFPKHLGGLEDDGLSANARCLLTVWLNGIAPVSLQLFAAEAQWAPPLSPSGEEAFSITWSNGKVACDQLLLKLDTSREGIKAKLNVAKKPKMQLLTSPCDMEDILLFSIKVWPSLFNQLVWALGSRLDAWVVAASKSTFGEAVNGSLICNSLVEAGSDNPGRKAVKEEISLHLTAARQCFANSFNQHHMISICCDFGRIFGKNTMVSAFAEPGGNAQWAPQQDPRAKYLM